jgi:hypothetical protein
MIFIDKVHYCFNYSFFSQKVNYINVFESRRPRIIWESLHPQIESYCSKVYEGTFYDIFSPLEAME